MEQKVQVLVDNVADSARAVLESVAGPRAASTAFSDLEDNGDSLRASDAGRALNKDIGQLRRLVQAAISALRNAEIEDEQRVKVIAAGVASPAVPDALVASSPEASIMDGKRGSGRRAQITPLKVTSIDDLVSFTR